MLLVTEWFGTFLVEDGRVEAAREFPRDAGEIARRLEAMELGEVLEEERALAEGRGGLRVAEPRLLGIAGTRLEEGAPSLRERAGEHGFPQELLRAAVLELARRKLRAALASTDLHVVQAVRAIDDLADAANVVAERLREWYGLHLPESDRLIERHEELAGLVSAHGTREAILAHAPHLKLEREALGAELGSEELEAIRGFARTLSTLYAQRAELERYLERAMPRVAPNLAALVGPGIAARLLALAGGLEALARMPSGTVQTLGAEKALFRHLKDGSRPPKHGVLFQHALVHRAPPRLRGPVARALAGKVAIAARADAFTKASVAGALLEGLEARVAELRAAPPRRARSGAGRAVGPRRGPGPGRKGGPR